MKRTFILLLVFAILLTLLAGCGTSTQEDAPAVSVSSDDNEEKTSPQNEAPAESEEVSADEEDTNEEDVNEVDECTNVVEYPISEEGITLSIYWQFHNFLSNFNVTQDVISTIPTFVAAEEATGVTLDFKLEGEQVYGEKIRLMWAAGDYCDLQCMAEMNYTAGVDSAVEEEVLLDMVPYLEEHAPDYLRIMEKHPDFRSELTSAEGHIVSFSEYCEYYDQGPVIRADWLEQLGLSYPETMDEVTETARAFKNELGAVNAVMWNSDLGTSFAWAGFGVVAPGESDLGYQIADDGVTVQASIMLEGSRKALTWMHDALEEGLCSEDFLTVHAMNYDNFIYSNECGIAYGNANLLAAGGAERSGQESYDLRAMANPMEEAGMVNAVGKKSGGVGASGISISALTEYPQEAMEYMNWLYTDEGILVSNYGFEGEGFEYDENGKPQYTDAVLNNPDGMPAFVATFVYTSLVGTPYYNTTERKIASFSTEAEKECIGVWTANNTGTALYQGKMNLEESEEYNALVSDVATHVSEQILRFVMGVRSLDEYDDFLDELDAMGIDRLIELKQAAYDRYLAN